MLWGFVRQVHDRDSQPTRDRLLRTRRVNNHLRTILKGIPGLEQYPEQKDHREVVFLYIYARLYFLIQYTYMKFGNTYSTSGLKRFLTAALLSSLTVGFLCISFAYSMSPHAGMDMSGSHSAYVASAVSLGPCCNPDASDHMEAWQSTFVGILQSFEILFALVAVAFVTLSFVDVCKLPRLAPDTLAVRYRQYAREHPDITAFHPLRLAFARGILNPKLF